MQKAENKRRAYGPPPKGAPKRGKKPRGVKLLLFKLKRKINKLMTVKPIKYITGGVICLVALVVVFRLFLLVFPIKSFEIQGDTHYDVNEIVDAAEIRSGQRLYAINEKKTAKKLIEGCPYIKDVKIKQKFPSTVCFVIEERVAGWYIQVGDSFYALDYDLKVLLEGYDEQDMKDRGLTKLVLPELQSVVTGEYPTFGNGDEHLISETLKIIDTVRTHRIKERLTYINLENRFEIKLAVGDKYTVNFGDTDDFETKVSMVEEIIKKSIVQGYDGGEINVINPDAHSFRGFYDNKPEATEPSKSDDEEKGE